VGRPRTAKHPKIAVMEIEDNSQEAPDTEPVFPLETKGFATASKTEAVRVALSEGLDSIDDIHQFVKAKFGHDMPKSLISSYKSRLGGSIKKPATVVEPTPKPEPTGKTMNKSEAARAALDAGYEKPAEAVAFIKNTFGIDMDAQYFSAIKTRTNGKGEASKKAEPAKRGRKPKAPAALVNGYVAPPEKPRSTSEPDLLLALEGVKELVGQFGAEKLKRIVDLLG
jgi:hypothetical protein